MKQELQILDDNQKTVFEIWKSATIHTREIEEKTWYRKNETLKIYLEVKHTFLMRVEFKNKTRMRLVLFYLTVL